jgi:hypothetical protein
MLYRLFVHMDGLTLFTLISHWAIFVFRFVFQTLLIK